MALGQVGDVNADLAAQLDAERVRAGVMSVRISELEGKLSERGMTGSLLLDEATIRTAPKFFSLMALVFRASGLKVVVVGGPGGDKIAANSWGIGFSDFKLVPGIERERALAKFTIAMQMLKDGPVIWPDLDFARWNGLPNVDKVKGLTILNWAAVQNDNALKPGKVAAG